MGWYAPKTKDFQTTYEVRSALALLHMHYGRVELISSVCQLLDIPANHTALSAMQNQIEKRRVRKDIAKNAKAPPTTEGADQPDTDASDHDDDDYEDLEHPASDVTDDED